MLEGNKEHLRSFLDAEAHGNCKLALEFQDCLSCEMIRNVAFVHGSDVKLIKAGTWPV